MTKTPQDDSETPAVSDLGDRARADDDTPSSGSFDDSAVDAGTAAGDPLAGVGTPEEPPAYPDGAEEHLES